LRLGFEAPDEAKRNPLHLRLLALVISSAGISLAGGQNVPKSSCDFDGFDVNSKLAEAAKPTTAYYGCAMGKCLPMNLRPGDPVVINRADGDWICGYLVARKGSAQGWVRSSDFRPVNFGPSPPATSWVGTWAQEENRIHIKSSKTPGKLDLKGEAYWHGGGDNVHEGEFSAEATPAGNKMHAEDDACKIDLALTGNYLLANDNNMCGGMNVRFWGVWKRSANR